MEQVIDGMDSYQYWVDCALSCTVYKSQPIQHLNT